MSQSLRPVVFLDRDGTLNKEVGYIRDIEHLSLIMGAGAAIKRLNDAQIAAILVTNQSGVARGYYPEKHIWNLHDRLKELLLREGASLDAVYYCPHLADGSVPEFAYVCNCRKPEPGLVNKAMAEHPDLDRG